MVMQPREEEWVSCPECHHYMMPLRSYTINKSERPSLGDVELWEFLLWGWMAFVYGYIYDALTYQSRKTKVENLHAQVLPQFPHSLICPGCLHVLKRR